MAEPSLDSKKISRELESCLMKAESILDWSLSKREHINHLHLELSLLYKPIQVGVYSFPLRTSTDEANNKEDSPCPVYSKCAQKVEELQFLLKQLQDTVDTQNRK